MLQRANFCRPMFHEPKFLMLDEPGGALDHFLRGTLLDHANALDAAASDRFHVTNSLWEAAFLGGLLLVMSAAPVGLTRLHLLAPVVAIFWISRRQARLNGPVWDGRLDGASFGI